MTHSEFSRSIPIHDLTDLTTDMQQLTSVLLTTNGYTDRVLCA